jgi:hypothetical protein
MEALMILEDDADFARPFFRLRFRRWWSILLVCVASSVGWTAAAAQRPANSHPRRGSVALLGAFPVGRFPGDAIFDYSAGLGGRIERDLAHPLSSTVLGVSGEVLWIPSSSDPSVTIGSVQAQATLYARELSTLRPYLVGGTGLAYSAVVNCAYFELAGGSSVPSSNCPPRRFGLAASVGVGTKSTRAPVFGELRFSHSGPELSTVTAAIGVSF